MWKKKSSYMTAALLPLFGCIKYLGKKKWPVTSIIFNVTQWILVMQRGSKVSKRILVKSNKTLWSCFWGVNPESEISSATMGKKSVLRTTKTHVYNPHTSKRLDFISRSSILSNTFTVCATPKIFKQKKRENFTDYSEWLMHISQI